MKSNKLALVAVPLVLTHCVVNEGTTGTATPAAADQASSGQGLTAKAANGRIAIMEAGKAVAYIIPASPNIEETRFTSGQEQIVVKSRGNHGPATVQLFDSRTGRQEDKIMAFEITDDQPAWAAGLGE